MGNLNLTKIYQEFIVGTAYAQTKKQLLPNMEQFLSLIPYCPHHPVEHNVSQVSGQQIPFLLCRTQKLTDTLRSYLSFFFSLRMSTVHCVWSNNFPNAFFLHRKIHRLSSAPTGRKCALCYSLPAKEFSHIMSLMSGRPSGI